MSETLEEMLNQAVNLQDPNRYLVNLDRLLLRFSTEDMEPAILRRVHEAKKNLGELINNTLYRGVDMDWGASFLQDQEGGIANYSNSFDFAKSYSGIVFEFEYKFDPAHVIIKNISDRHDVVNEHDVEIGEMPQDGFAWFISDGLYHFRLKSSSLKLKSIHYCGDGIKESISFLTMLNRKFTGLSQVKFAERLGTKQPKVAQYENKERIPDIERIVELAQFIPYPQEIAFGERNLVIQ